MAVDDNFAQAWLSTSHKVFGYKLKPFSLWHKFLLGVSDSPILKNGEAEVSIPEIIQACKICTVSYPNSPTKSRLWNQAILFFRIRPKKVLLEASKFTTYLQDFCSGPEFWDKEDSKSNKGSAPDTLAAAVSLMLLGFPEKEAWDMPVGKASWYSSVNASWQGADLDFVTSDEKELRENWKEMEEELTKMEEEFVPPGETEDDAIRIRNLGRMN